MPRTKRKFDDDDSSSDDNDSSSDDNDDSHPNSLSHTATTTTISRSTYSGGGKQLSRMMGRPGGGGKQMRFLPQGEDDDDDDDDSDEEESEEEEGGGDDDGGDGGSEESDDGGHNNQANTVTITRGGGGGKIFRPAMGGGKNLRNHGDDDDDDDDDDSDDDDDNDNENGSDYEAPRAQPPPMYRGGGGKSLGMMQRRLQNKDSSDENEDEDEDESDDSSEGGDDKPVQTHVVIAPSRGMGKQLRPPEPKPSEPNVDEDSDEDDDSDDDNDNQNNEANDKNDEDDSDDESQEAEFEPDDPPPSTTTTTATRNRNVSVVPRGGGKVFRPPTADSDNGMDESDSSDSDDSDTSHPTQTNSQPPTSSSSVPTPSAQQKSLAPKTEEDVEDMDVSSEEENEMMDEDEEDEEEEDSDDDSDMETDALDERKLVEGADDKKYLDSLPEIERESILAQRFEKLKAKADMKKALSESKRKEREQKKREQKNSGKKSSKTSKKSKTTSEDQAEDGEMEVSDDDDENDNGKTKAAATDGNDTSKTNELPDTSADLKLAKDLALDREVKHTGGIEDKKKQALEQLRKEGLNKDDDEDDNDSSDESDYGSDEESQNDEYKPWKKSKVDDDDKNGNDSEDNYDDFSRKGFVEADLRDFYNVTIPRRRLCRWCNEPYFEKAVLKFYVRLAIGRDTKTQRPCYRLCKIVRVEKRTEYAFPPSPGEVHQKPVKTNKWLELKFADSTRMFKMNGISDSKPTQEDVTQYITQLKNRRSEVPSKKEAIKMKKEQDQLINNYVYTKEDIEKTIAERKNMSKTIYNLGAEKSRVNLAVQASTEALAEAKANCEELERSLFEADDDALVDELEKAKETLKKAEIDLKEKKEDQRKVLKAEANRRNRISKSKVQDWVKVNERAKKDNQLADVKKKNIETGKKVFNPYARRDVKAKNLWDIGQEKKPDAKKKLPEATSVKTETKAKVTTKPAGRDDSDEGVKGDGDARRELHNGHNKENLTTQIKDLVLDEEFFSRGSDGVKNDSGYGDNKGSITRIRRGISIQEYLERKRLGTL